MTALLFAELSKFQKNMEGAKKDALNPHFKSKYADLESVVQCIKDYSKELKLSYTHVNYRIDGMDFLKTVLAYSDGEKFETIESSLPLMLTGNNPMQAMGSAITYAKRYTLQGLYGIPSEDDDGNSSVRPPIKKASEATIEDIKKEIEAAKTEDDLKKVYIKHQSHTKIKSHIVPLLSEAKTALIAKTTEEYLDDTLDNIGVLNV
jgi:hypothetical protein